MADEPDVQAAEITPENFDGEQAAPKAEPSTVKEAPAKAEPPKEPEAAKDTKEEPAVATPPDVPTKDDKTKPDEAEKPEGEEETPEDKPPEKTEPQPTKAEERKTQLNTEIRDLVAQRNALKSEVEKQNAEVYQVATEDELVEGGMTAIEAKVESMRQEQEMEKFNSRVADAQLTISSESDRVLRDFPIFNPDSDSYDEELANEAASHLSSMLITDPNSNQVIGSNGSVYQYYKTLARASGISEAKGQLQGQADTERQLANADSPSSRAPEKKPEDPLAKLWETDL